MNKWRRSGPREGMEHTNDHLHSVSEKRREKKKKGSSRRRSHRKGLTKIGNTKGNNDFRMSWMPWIYRTKNWYYTMIRYWDHLNPLRWAGAHTWRQDFLQQKIYGENTIEKKHRTHSSKNFFYEIEYSL
jgi:hypothetical protein